MPQDQKDIIWEYTNNEGINGKDPAYAIWNRAYREGNLTPEIKEKGILLSETLKGMPKYSGKTYRVISFEDEVQLENYLESKKENIPEMLFGFTSSSIDKSEAERGFMKNAYNVHITFESKKGTYLGELSMKPHQKEVLFNNEETFKIRKLDITDKKNIKIRYEDIE